MTFDFGVLVAVILLVTFFIIGVAKGLGLFNLLCVPLSIFLIIWLLGAEEGTPDYTFVILTLSGFAMINAYLTIISYFGKD